MKKAIKLILKTIVIFVFKNFIILSLFYFQSIKRKKIIYSNSLGFGDHIIFYLDKYLLIQKNNFYTFQFCRQIDQPLHFFF